MIQNNDRHVLSSWFLFYQIFWTYCFSNLHGNVVVVIVWPLDLQIHMQSVPIATNAVSSNHVHCEVYSIQQYVIKFVRDWRQVHQYNWPARYNRNNAESGVKHQINLQYKCHTLGISLLLFVLLNRYLRMQYYVHHSLSCSFYVFYCRSASHIISPITLLVS